MGALETRGKQPYHKLLVWQKADEFLKMVYHETACFPDHERYGITSQWRRAALSIALNLVEGQARGSTADYCRFVIMARGSASECAYLLEISRDLKYLKEDRFVALEEKLSKLNYFLQRLLEGLRATS